MGGFATPATFVVVIAAYGLDYDNDLRPIDRTKVGFGVAAPRREG